MANLLKALIGGVPSLINADAVARSAQSATVGSTALSPGKLVAKSGGNLVYADSTLSLFALGYLMAGFSASAVATYFTDGVNNNVSGLTENGEVYLGANGGVTTTPTEPGIGQGWQAVGRANSPTSFVFVPQTGYTRAS